MRTSGEQEELTTAFVGRASSIGKGDACLIQMGSRHLRGCLLCGFPDRPGRMDSVCGYHLHSECLPG